MEARKGQNKLHRKAALRPPNRVQVAVRKSGLEATQQDSSTCEDRRRCGRRTVVIRKGGVMAAEQGHSSIQAHDSGLCSRSRVMFWEAPNGLTESVEIDVENRRLLAVTP